MRKPGREQTVALAAAAVALALLVWGVLAEQLGDTLFNATLV